MLTLAPNASFAARDAYDRADMFLVNQGGRIVVADVRAGTPAAGTGIVRGEALTTFSSREAPAQGLSAIRELFRASGTAITLTVSGKDGTSRSATLTLRNYV
jgi:C-terminal processing protease CtpA/Prc